MITVKIKDRLGNELNFGDIVKISDGRKFKFYSEVKYLEKEKAIAPFHTFCFHSIEKVDSLPRNAKKGDEERYDFWYICNDEAETDEAAERANEYLLSWRECERFLEKSCFSIEIK